METSKRRAGAKLRDISQKAFAYTCAALGLASVFAEGKGGEGKERLRQPERLPQAGRVKKVRELRPIARASKSYTLRGQNVYVSRPRRIRFGLKTYTFRRQDVYVSTARRIAFGRGRYSLGCSEPFCGLCAVHRVKVRRGTLAARRSPGGAASTHDKDRPPLYEASPPPAVAEDGDAVFTARRRL